MTQAGTYELMNIVNSLKCELKWSLIEDFLEFTEKLLLYLHYVIKIYLYDSPTVLVAGRRMVQCILGLFPMG